MKVNMIKQMPWLQNCYMPISLIEKDVPHYHLYTLASYKHSSCSDYGRKTWDTFPPALGSSLLVNDAGVQHSRV